MDIETLVSETKDVLQRAAIELARSRNWEMCIKFTDSHDDGYEYLVDPRYIGFLPNLAADPTKFGLPEGSYVYVGVGGEF